MHSRREVLAAGCLVLAGGSGCSQIRDAVVDDTTTTTATASDETETTTGTAEATTGTDEESEFRVVVTDGEREVELVTGADVASVGDVERARTGDGYRLPMTLTDEGTTAFADGLEQVGAFENPDEHRIRTYFADELLYEAKLGPSLADAMESGEWDGQFLFHVSDRETAEEVKAALENE